MAHVLQNRVRTDAWQPRRAHHRSFYRHGHLHHARLLQSGLIKPDELPHKYRNEIHANEIVLLAYYIAAINIEAAYHDITGKDYEPFEGICLTDTFQMYEKEDMVDQLLAKNSGRRKRQKALDIRVIVGNPPYSKGQEDANDNNANLVYPCLDTRIRDTYAVRSRGQNKNGLYNSYIRAIRWASDRIGESGIVGFVTNGGWIEGIAESGIRRCLTEDFSSVYVFHLRGNQRTSGELSRKEGGKIFGSGSRAPIAISILLKNPNAKHHGQIKFYDIGDYLGREDKLEKISAFVSIDGITSAQGWQTITPDKYGDWLKHRDDSFGNFMALGDKSANEAPKLFEIYSRGVATARDAWCYNPSRTAVENNMQSMIDFYNNELIRFNSAHIGHDKKSRDTKLDDFINTDTTKISWNRGLKQELAKNRSHDYNAKNLTPSLYRPYTKQWLYYSRVFNDMVYQMPRIFPDANSENLVISVSAPGFTTGFCALVANIPPELCVAAMKGGTQCFPLYLYEEIAEVTLVSPQEEMFTEERQTLSTRVRRDAITDAGAGVFSHGLSR